MGSVSPTVTPAGPPPEAGPTPFLVEQAEARKEREAALEPAAAEPTSTAEPDQEPSEPVKAPIIVAQAPGTIGAHGTLSHHAKIPEPGTVFTPKTKDQSDA